MHVWPQWACHEIYRALNTLMYMWCMNRHHLYTIGSSTSTCMQQGHELQYWKLEYYIYFYVVVTVKHTTRFTQSCRPFGTGNCWVKILINITCMFWNTPWSHSFAVLVCMDRNHFCVVYFTYVVSSVQCYSLSFSVRQTCILMYVTLIEILLWFFCALFFSHGHGPLTVAIFSARW